MIKCRKCGPDCVAICDYCKYVIHRYTYTEENNELKFVVEGCEIHPDKKVGSKFSCNDFYCDRERW